MAVLARLLGGKDTKGNEARRAMATRVKTPTSTSLATSTSQWRCR
jgi:hypothetical protein